MSTSPPCWNVTTRQRTYILVPLRKIWELWSHIKSLSREYSRKSKLNFNDLSWCFSKDTKEMPTYTYQCTILHSQPTVPLSKVQANSSGIFLNRLSRLLFFANSRFSLLLERKEILSPFCFSHFPRFFSTRVSKYLKGTQVSGFCLSVCLSVWLSVYLSGTTIIRAFQKRSPSFIGLNAVQKFFFLKKRLLPEV